MQISFFGNTDKNEETRLYTCSSGSSVFTFTDYGAALVSWRFKGVDVVLGYDDPKAYENGKGCFGAVVGRCANRIGNGEFVLDGKRYTLTKNNGNNTLHGGVDPYNKRLWTASGADAPDSVTFTLSSPDMDQGFPGNLTLSVTYTVTENDELIIDYTGKCDKDTLLNPTNHSYFNLNGHASGNIAGHEITIYAESFTPNDAGCLPDGRILSVKGTPFDLTDGRKIGDGIDVCDEQIRFGNGYDHNYCLDMDVHPLKKAASVYSEQTGISMDVFTDMPGMQFYTGNSIPAGTAGKENAVYGPRDGFCLETQYFPDGINKEAFAAPVLRAGETFRSRTVYHLY